MTLNPQYKFSMIFRIKKRVEYGEAIYIAGNIPQLGEWKIQKAFRLTWNQKDIWTGTLQLTCPLPNRLQYKYFISLWSGPKNSSILWEDGNYNRLIYPKMKYNDHIIDDKWNMQKISLNLMIPQNQDVYNNYSVIGNHIQLGNWKIKKQLTKRNKHSKGILNEIDTDQDSWDDYNIYTYSFEIYRGRQKFRYYYIRQVGHFCEPQRHPGRLFVLGKQNSHHPDYIKTVYTLGKVQHYEKCNFKMLNFSKITDYLYVGAYPKNIQDIKKLKQQGINAILSIQTPQDYQRHQISQMNFHNACHQQGIQSISYSIKDMDKQQFTQKAEGALQILKKWSLMKYTIYVHCSAGIYRSPQILILHLIQMQGLNLQKAAQLVKSKHPYANPNLQLIFKTTQKIRSNKLILINEEQNESIFLKQTYQELQVENNNEIFQHH